MNLRFTLLTCCLLIISSSLFSQTTHDVSVVNGAFIPASLEIEMGDIVRWTNNEGFHSVDANSVTYPDNPEEFGNTAGPDGWIYEFTFSESGFYEYRCGVHPVTMLGDITVSTSDVTIHEVTVSNFVFTPDFLEIEEGDMVRWTNIEGFHSVDANETDFPDNPEVFGNEPAAAPWVYEFIFNTAGTYDYQCAIHTFMIGQISVIEAGDELASIDGLIEWDPECGGRALTILIYEPGSINFVDDISTELSSAGTYSLEDILPGEYDIYLKVDGNLQFLEPNINLIPGVNQLFSDTPVVGDLNGDNGINIVDISVVNAAFGSVDGNENYNPLADMNCDGGVNIIDISILNAGFGMIGDSPGVI